MALDIPINEVDLFRGDTGLGFNIKGGIDAPLFHNDPGIFVTKVKESGAAFRDGRIKEGDKVIEINGDSLERVTHNEAVSIFVNAGNAVKMKIQHGAETVLLEQEKKALLANAKKSRRFPWKTVLFLSVVCIGVGSYFGYRKWKLK